MFFYYLHYRYIESDLKLQANMIIALAFVPPMMIDVYVDKLADNLPPELQPLMLWFEDYYIGRPDSLGNLHCAFNCK